MTNICVKVQNFIHRKIDKNVLRTDELGDAHEEFNVPMYILRFIYIITQVAFVVLLLIFFYITYNSDRNTKYLSLDDDVGSDSPYGVCNSIPVALTGHWSLDANGYWEGETNYNQSLAYYKFKLSSFSKSPAQYKRFVTDFKSQIDAIGN